MTTLNITVIALCLLTTAAQADTLIIHGLSHHDKPRLSGQPWEQVNTGLGLRREFAHTLSGQAGIYRNSYGKTTVYALADYEPLRYGALSGGVFGGVATGYPQAPVRVIAGFVGRAQVGSVSFALRYGPGPKPVLALEAGINF